MIDFYTAATPNGHKIAIALEEMGLEYTTTRSTFRTTTKNSPHLPRLTQMGVFRRLLTVIMKILRCLSRVRFCSISQRKLESSYPKKAKRAPK